MIRDWLEGIRNWWADRHCVVCGRLARDGIVHPVCLRRLL